MHAVLLLTCAVDMNIEVLHLWGGMDRLSFPMVRILVEDANNWSIGGLNKACHSSNAQIIQAIPAIPIT